MTAGEDKPAAALAALEHFYRTSLEEELARHQRESAGEAALRLFQRTLADVPAYAEFLRQAGFDAAQVRSPGDFGRLPVPTKETYHRRHALSALCRGGDLSGSDMLAVSSGSTGEPAVW